MKLSFDETVSWRLVRRLAVLFPDSQHADLVARKGQIDLELWAYAARQGFTLVSKDNDLRSESDDRGISFRISFISSATDRAVPPVPEVLSRLRSCSSWDPASLSTAVNAGDP